MAGLDEAIPVLSDAVKPPVVLGTAELTHLAYQANGHAALLARINEFGGAEVGRRYDTAIALQLAFRRADGLEVLDEVLAESHLFRLGHAAGNALRLLALVCPGDLMTNLPLDFLTRHLNVRLDLLYVLPNQPLPSTIPDHDAAFFAAGEADPLMLARLGALYAAWPRPALNDPRWLPALERDALARSLRDIPGVCSPAAVATTRNALGRHVDSGVAICGFGLPSTTYPCLIRPYGSHAGVGLERLNTPAEMQSYLQSSFAHDFFLTAFHDYRGPDGLYRKSRVAFIDRQPMLCHMAVSSHWMVHYLNAGMEESTAKRAEEAEAMASFDTGFARRHAAAFEALHQYLPFDFYSIDCAETQDGRLLVFEADTAAIIHAMDPPDLFPYKQPQMWRVFMAFDALLRRKAGCAGSG
ncbi:MAG: hypothetical protein B7Z80_07255 [Rhodospirillales bacterium 20-64-7]|nr:MAG: hypothetical protein B7Z80_07255 [Rhodospirillales bacterium 20-64-7]